MRTITSNAYATVREFGYGNVKHLPLDTTLGVYETPYREVPLETFDNTEAKLTMYTTEDIAFVNTKEFTKSGQNYLKTGKYTTRQD